MRPYFIIVLMVNQNFRVYVDVFFYFGVFLLADLLVKFEFQFLLVVYTYVKSPCICTRENFDSALYTI